MEVTFGDIISVISLLLGGGGLGFFFSVSGRQRCLDYLLRTYGRGSGIGWLQ